MWRFRRIDPGRVLSELTLDSHYVSFIGAGGKTSLIEHLASVGIRHKKRAVITTTTKIWVKEPYALLSELHSGRAMPDFMRVGKSVEQRKLTGLEPQEVATLGSNFDLVLIEADGSKGKPLKYPANYEPVIPSFSDRVILIAGLDALSGRLDEQVFRHELFERATGTRADAHITPSLFLRFMEDDAMMKGVDRDKCVIVLNKYDACAEKHAVPGIAKAVLEASGVGRVLVCSILFETYYDVIRV